jgi:light-regulated signal transduction histidine kinase (bacteriophytochrome)
MNRTGELEHANAELELTKKELELARKELEAFSYSVSHDLRAPLRVVDGFSKILLDKHGAKLDEEGRQYLERVRGGAQKLASLIEDLLGLSRIARAPLKKEVIGLTEMARTVIGELREKEPSRKVMIEIADRLVAFGDARLISRVLASLLGNAWKFTAKEPEARIAVGQEEQGNESVFFVRDNGVRFKMTYADKLFAPFQRLHGESEFEGNGIGLAIAQRIIARHGGRIWADSAPGKGTTIFFTLGSAA